MLHRTEGIVLRTREFGEADLIVTFLTKDVGLIHAFAKSPRKTKSRFGSSLEPLTYVRLSFWGKEHANLPRLTQADIIKSFQQIRDSFDCFFKVSELLEIILICCPERDISLHAFGFLLKALYEMQRGWTNPVLLLSLKIKLLKITGFAPKLKGCARCGEEGTVFHYRDGAVLCSTCKPSDVHSCRMSTGVIKLYECLARWPVERVCRIKQNDLLIKELTTLISSHVKYYISRERTPLGEECRFQSA